MKPNLLIFKLLAITHTLFENGSIKRKDNQFVLSRKLPEIQVPDTVQEVIAARMDGLGQPQADYPCCLSDWAGICLSHPADHSL